MSTENSTTIAGLRRRPAGPKPVTGTCAAGTGAGSQGATRVLGATAAGTGEALSTGRSTGGSSAAGTPSPAGGNGSKTAVHAVHVDQVVYEDENEGDDEPLADGEGWSPEAAAARRRAQQRWRELNPGPVLPSLTLTEEEAAALLPPVEPPVAVASPALSTRVAPWLPTPVPAVGGVAVTAFGPAGRRRSPAMVVLLSVLTLGFYALWWHHRVNREMAEFDPRMSVDAGRSTWAVAVPLIIGWMVAAAAGARYLLALGGTPTADLPISAEQSLFLAFSPLVVPYLELLLPFSAAAVVMTHERARIIEDRVDVPSDRQLRPVSALGWLTVPVVGGLVGMARMQQHLNEVWRTVTS